MALPSDPSPPDRAGQAPDIAASPILTPADLCTKLQSRLEAADLDGALLVLSGIDIFDAVQRAGSQQDRLAYMSADVLDYGGRYEMSEKLLDLVGQNAKKRMTAFLRERNSHLSQQEANERKHEVWTVIQLGMCYYRRGEDSYPDALQCFESAREALLRIEADGHSCTGSLSRACFCIGLVHRQTGRDRLAIDEFSNCISYGWKGIQERSRDGKSTGSFDYHLGKCFGLGRAWLSYNEALLATAEDYVVAARRLLHVVDPRKEKVCFIHAYIEIVHADIIMSRHSEPQRLDEAIGILTRAYDDLGGDAALKHPRVGHRPYALRALVELARGYLQRALASAPERQEDRREHLKLALGVINKAKSSAGLKNDRRNQCNALIVESRIYRAQGQCDEALRAAEAAMLIGGRGEFTRVDCWITMGEAKYWCSDYKAAVAAFGRALEFSQNNRKTFAVCNLHLANTYLKLPDRAKAREHFSVWEATGRALDNAFIRDLANSVRISLGEFLVTADQISEEISAGRKTLLDDHVKALQKWITEVTLARVERDKSKAEDLLSRDWKTLKGYLDYIEGTAAGEERK